MKKKKKIKGLEFQIGFEIQRLQNQINEIKKELQEVKQEPEQFKSPTHEFLDSLPQNKQKPETFETFHDWKLSFPKSYKEFNTGYYYGFDPEIWECLNDILDYFDKEGYVIENYIDEQYFVYSYFYTEKNVRIGKNRKEAFLKCFFKLLEEYEKTL